MEDLGGNSYRLQNNEYVKDAESQKVLHAPNTFHVLWNSRRGSSKGEIVQINTSHHPVGTIYPLVSELVALISTVKGSE